jgi:hypothetical protein
VRVPAGGHLVEFEYRPSSFKYGATITGLAVSLAGWMLIGEPLRTLHKRRDETIRKDYRG